MLILFTLLVAVVAVSVNSVPVPRHHNKINEQKYLVKLSDRSGRIVGGLDSRIEDFPYQVGLFFDRSHICGGSILNVNTILSAAKCTFGLNRNNFQVLAGHSSITADDLIDVIWVEEHPEYDALTFVNDIAVLRLQRNLTFSDKIQPTVLPSPHFHVESESTAVVSGWGDLRFEGSDFPDILQSVKVTTMTNFQCQAAYIQTDLHENILEQHICAGDEGRDACQGDIGGPLVYNGIQVGVVSWGIGCGSEWPTVYSRVSEFLLFITQQMSRE